MRVALAYSYPLFDRVNWRRHLLESLINSEHECAIVFTRSSMLDHLKLVIKRRKAGRLATSINQPQISKTAKKYRPLKTLIKAGSLPVLYTRSVNLPNVPLFLRKFNADLLITAIDEIISRRTLNLIECPIINPHYGSLPYYRGMSSAEWSILNGDVVCVTVHLITPGVDEGPILMKTPIVLDPGDSLQSIRIKQQQRATDMLLSTVNDFEKLYSGRIPQEKSQGKQHFQMSKELLSLVEEKLKFRAA